MTSPDAAPQPPCECLTLSAAATLSRRVPGEKAATSHSTGSYRRNSSAFMVLSILSRHDSVCLLRLQKKFGLAGSKSNKEPKDPKRSWIGVLVFRQSLG